MSEPPRIEPIVGVRAPAARSSYWRIQTGHRLHYVPGVRHKHGHWRCLDCGLCHVATHHFLGVPCTPARRDSL
jgi:hypothetical protein